MKLSYFNFKAHICLSLFVAAISMLASGCRSERKPELLTIDIVSNLEVPDRGSLDELFEMEFMIRPEVTDTTLLSFANVRGMYGNLVYVQEDNRLMVFNAGDGRCVWSFDHTGDSPEDYTLIQNAFVASDNGDWVAFDTRNRRIMRYTPDGEFVGAWYSDIDCLCPDGKRWVAQKFVAEEEKQVIYIYGDNFTLTDSILTDLPRYYMAPNSFDTFNGRPDMKAADTLYTVTPDKKLAPTLAFNLGKFLMPNYREEEFDKMMSERHRYLTFEFYGAAGLGALNYRYNDRVMLQFYSLTDGKLLFSAGEFPAHFTGFPFTVNGKSIDMVPTGQPSDDAFFFMIPSNQFDDKDGNPAILKLRIKTPYSTPFAFEQSSLN